MDTLSNFDLINLLVVIVLGAIGTYLLLPHAHGIVKPMTTKWVGLGLSALAILGFSLFLKTGNVELISRIFFYLFAFLAIGSAVLTITSRDPVHSALWFAAVVLATSGLFLLSGAQFLAAGTVIVYAGAIIVTFLFVIMLAQSEGRAVYDRMARAPFLATLSGFLLLFALMYPLLGLKPHEADKGQSVAEGGFDRNRLASLADRPAKSRETSPHHRVVLDRAMTSRSMLPEMTKGSIKPPHVASLGTALFTDHLLTIELAGSLLFVALIGALAIATPKPPIRPTVGSTTPPKSL